MLEEALIEVALEDKYGKTEIANAGKILRILWEEVGAEAFEEWVRRGALLVQSKAVLLSQLHGQDEDGELQTEERDNRQGTSKENHAVIALRGLWEEWQNSGSPHRRKPAEQLARKLDKTLLELSRETASVEKFMCCVRIATKGEGFMPEALPADAESAEAVCYAASFMGGQGSNARSIAWTEEATPPLKSVPSGSNAVPDVCYPINTMVATRWNKDDNRTTFGIGEPGDPQFTLGAAHEHGVCYAVRTAQTNANGIGVAQDAHTLDGANAQAVCYSLDRASFNQGINAQYKPQIEEELASALVARGPSAVCYPIDSHQQDSRFRVCSDGITPTLPGQMGTGGNNGQMVLETYTAGNGQTNQPLLKEQARTLDCMHDQQIVIEPDKPPRKYIIRRLTPLECCRLQGFPDWWEDGVQGSDSARYRMWGNGIALPNAEYVIGCAKKLIEEG